MKNRIEEIFSDREFAERALSLSPEELQAVLRDEKGVDVSLEEIRAAGEAINSLISKGSELSDQDLDLVAGGGAVGGFILGVVGAWGAFGVGCLIGLGAVSW